MIRRRTDGDRGTKEGPNKATFWTDTEGESPIDRLSERRVVLVQETVQRPQDKSILVALEGTMRKRYAFFRDKRDRGQGRICGHDSRKKKMKEKWMHMLKLGPCSPIYLFRLYSTSIHYWTHAYYWTKRKKTKPTWLQKGLGRKKPS